MRTYLDAEFESVSVNLGSFFVADSHHHLEHLLHVTLKGREEGGRGGREEGEEGGRREVGRGWEKRD